MKTTLEELSQINIDNKIAFSQIQEICIKQMQLADLTGNFARIAVIKEINAIAEREIKR